MNTDHLEWHDGVLASVHLTEQGRASVTCDLYPSPEAKTRKRFSIDCVDVVAYSCTIDMLALQINKKAGNINDGRLLVAKRGLSVLKLFLSDGYLELRAKRIDLTPAR